MRITVVEPVQLGEWPNLCFVRLHTDAGLVGLGETFFGAHELAAYLHETAAPRLLGKDSSAIDGLRVAVQQHVGTRSTGVGARGSSAVDLALRDPAGKAAGCPVVRLLGGRTRETIRVYNTCAGYNAPNARIQETVRAFFTGWYTALVSGLPVVEDGRVRLGSEGPGLGLELRPGLTERPDAAVRRSVA